MNRQSKVFWCSSPKRQLQICSIYPNIILSKYWPSWPRRRRRKERRRQRFPSIKNHPIGHLNGLRRMEGLLFKGMYVAMLLTLIHVIWLKGNKLTQVAKKLLSLVVLVEKGAQVNWVVVVFKNLYNNLRDLFTPTKLEVLFKKWTSYFKIGLW